jgi:hypothetical protein
MQIAVYLHSEELFQREISTIKKCMPEKIVTELENTLPISDLQCRVRMIQRESLSAILSIKEPLLQNADNWYQFQKNFMKSLSFFPKKDAIDTESVLSDDTDIESAPSCDSENVTKNPVQGLQEKFANTPYLKDSYRRAELLLFSKISTEVPTIQYESLASMQDGKSHDAIEPKEIESMFIEYCLLSENIEMANVLSEELGFSSYQGFIANNRSIPPNASDDAILKEIGRTLRQGIPAVKSEIPQKSYYQNAFGLSKQLKSDPLRECIQKRIFILAEKEIDFKFASSLK